MQDDLTLEDHCSLAISAAETVELHLSAINSVDTAPLVRKLRRATDNLASGLRELTDLDAATRREYERQLKRPKLTDSDLVERSEPEQLP